MLCLQNVPLLLIVDCFCVVGKDRKELGEVKVFVEKKLGRKFVCGGERVLILPLPGIRFGAETCSATSNDGPPRENSVKYGSFDLKMKLSVMNRKVHSGVIAIILRTGW
jgi:hypothetical protein